MSYYDLVKITGKDTEIYLTTAEGKEITDIEPYFNKKKYMADRKHAFIIDIPEKNMYVLMQGETNKFLAALSGMSIPRYKMNFRAFNAKTDEKLWNKQYTVLFDCDLITTEPFIRMFYDQGMLFVEHDHFKTPDKGLTVLNPDNGEIMWEAQFRTEELKSKGLTKLYVTPFPAPHPLTKNGKTYVVNKTKNIVSCYDAAKGTKLWDSQEFPDSQKIPALFATDKLLIMGHGGDAVKTVSITKSSGSASDYDYHKEYNNKDKYGIIAYDAATGKVVWSNETIEKAAKDKFEYIAGLEMIGGKLYCATDKNFFILDPQTGNVEKSVPVAKEKVGDAWKMIYFEKEQKIILNCEKGIVKLDPVAAKVDGKVETPTMPFMLPFKEMKADDHYKDYAVFTDGDAETWKLKEFASIDLDNMKVRGVDEGDLLFYEPSHFSQGGEMFYKVDDEEIRFFSLK
jgi:outer membrane protein assembly factor BamB